MARKPKEHTGPVGGLFFFLTIPILIFVAALNASFLAARCGWQEFGRMLSALPAAGLAGLLVWFAVRGRLSVFIHEFKHSVVSGLAGNRSRGMRVRNRTGHFEYEYTKDTAHLNALIALAPYWFPLAAILALAVLIPFGGPHSLATRALLGAALGADAVLNARDISPHQTDFSEIRGGYRVGVLYVLGMNLMLWSFAAALLAWGWYGPVELLKGYWLAGAALVRR